MSCDNYSASALMGNWFEERQAAPQQSKINPDKTLVRKGSDLKFVSKKGDIKLLSKIPRKPKWDTKAVTLNQGYSCFEPLMKESFRKSLITQYYKHQDLRPIKKGKDTPYSERTNEHLLTMGPKHFKMTADKHQEKYLTKKELKRNHSDFTSTLRNFQKHKAKFYGSTNYRDAFCSKDDIFNLSTGKGFSSSKRLQRRKRAGVSQSIGHGKIHRKERATFLIGELYRDFEDPKQNVHIQRSWVYGGETSLKAAESKLNRTLRKLGGIAKPKAIINAMTSNIFASKAPRPDAPNSLPLENGERSFFPILSHVGGHRRIRSTVTRRMNKGLTYK